MSIEEEQSVVFSGSIMLKLSYCTFLGRLESCEKPKDKVYLVPNMNISAN